MNKVWELLQEPDIVVLFDVDGTLTSYNYGEYHAHHELDFTPEFRDVNIYADCKRLMPMYNSARIKIVHFKQTNDMSRKPSARNERSEWRALGFGA